MKAKSNSNKYDKPRGSKFNNNDLDRLRMIIRTDENFATSNSDDLYRELDERYPNRGTFSVIAYTLKKFFEEIKNQRKADYWEEVAKELSGMVHNQEMKNELTNNEKQNWKDQEQIMKIMNNIDIQNRTDYNRFLLLAMCTFQAPLRKAFYQSVKFCTDKKKINKTDNYVFLQKYPNKSYYIINKDKVSKYEKFNEPESMLIELTNPDLIKLLWDSYNQLNREYVFETEEGKPYSMNSICILLLERPFNLNFNILRSSYVSNFYDKNPSLADKNELAKKMRHSVNIAELSYNKIC